MAESKKKALVVTAALVAVKTDDGRRIYLYRGAEVGEGFNKDDVARLKDLKMVSEDPAEDVVPGVGA